MGRRFARPGVALAGGAAKGLAHIGVLKALEEVGIRPACIVGTSAGALVGGLYAAGLSVADMERVVSELDGWEFSKLLDLTWAKGSLVAGKAVSRFLRDLVGDVRIEDLRIPFIAVAVDINSGRGHFFDRGPLVDAIRASISIPGIFEPFAANGSYLVDGGVRLNLPLRALDQFRPTIRIGVGLTGSQWFNAEWTQGEIERDHGPDKDPDRNLWQRVKDRFSGDRDSAGEEEDEDEDDEPPGLPFLLARTFNTFTAEAERLEVARTRPHLFINLDVNEIELWEFWRGVEAVELGYSQSQPLIAQFLRDRTIAGRIRKWFAS